MNSGRGYRKHKSGSRGGVGRAGVWSHNKQKYAPITKEYKSRYIKLSKILLNFERYKTLGFVFENKEEILIDTNKFYKVIEITKDIQYNEKPVHFKGNNKSECKH